MSYEDWPCKNEGGNFKRHHYATTRVAMPNRFSETCLRCGEPRKAEREYCAAVTRKQAEAATWGASHVGCGKLAVTEVEEFGEKHPVCRIHSDALKRYGWNR